MGFFRYVYGPIFSRRQGLSLGVDLFHKKVCSFDCIYCEVGKTKQIANPENYYATTDEISKELAEAIRAAKTKPDVVCFAGNGEPTLHPKLLEMILIAKDITKLPVSVITNGAHFHNQKVSTALLEADIVLPSLNSALQQTYDSINRPLRATLVEDIIRDISKFRSQYNGLLWLEIFIVPGVNDDEIHLDAFEVAIKQISPDKVHINTLQRPGTELFVMPATKSAMSEIASRLGPKAEVIADGVINQS